MSGAATAWRRIDPRSVVVDSVPHVATTWLTFVLVRESFPFDDRFVREYLQQAAVVVAVAGVLHRLVRWATTFYAVEERTVRLRTGWLLRRRTAVDRAKVRAVVLRSRALARPLGLTRVSLGTGETLRDAPVVLAWVPTATARRLRCDLLDHARPAVGDPGVLARGRPGWALWAPFTALSVSIWAGTYAVAYQLFVAYFAWWRTLEWFLTEQVDLLAALRALVVVPVVVAVVGAVLVHLECWWGFRLERTPRGKLEARYGLVVLRSMSLQESRMRGVEFVQPLLPRPLHRARLLAVTTGAGAQATLVRRLPAARRRTLLPLGPAVQAARAASAVLDREVDLADLLGHPVQARYKRYRWAALFAGLVLLVVWLLFEEPLRDRTGAFVLAGLVLLAAALVVADDNYRSLTARSATGSTRSCSCCAAAPCGGWPPWFSGGRWSAGSSGSPGSNIGWGSSPSSSPRPRGAAPIPSTTPSARTPWSSPATSHPASSSPTSTTPGRPRGGRTGRRPDRSRRPAVPTRPRTGAIRRRGSAPGRGRPVRGRRNRSRPPTAPPWASGTGWGTG